MSNTKVIKKIVVEALENLKTQDIVSIDVSQKSLKLSNFLGDELVK